MASKKQANILLIRSEPPPNAVKKSKQQRFCIRKSESPKNKSEQTQQASHQLHLKTECESKESKPKSSQKASQEPLILGLGNFGPVHMVFHQGTFRARKTISCTIKYGQKNDKKAYKQIGNEIENMRKFDHANIVKCISTNYDEEAEYQPEVILYFDLCGTTLLHLLLVRNAYAESERYRQEQKDNKEMFQHRDLSVVYQIINGVVHMHDCNVVHRELQPDNIMINGKGKVQITDVGCSESIKSVMGLKRKVDIQPYMSPEFLDFAPYNYDAKCDKWSIGIMALEMCEPKKLYFLVEKYITNSNDDCGHQLKIYTDAVVDEIVQKNINGHAIMIQFIRRALEKSIYKRSSLKDTQKYLFDNYDLESTIAHKSNKIIGQSYLSSVNDGKVIDITIGVYCFCGKEMSRCKLEELVHDGCWCDDCNKKVLEKKNPDVYHCDNFEFHTKPKEEQKKEEIEEEKQREREYVNWCIKCAMIRNDVVNKYVKGD